MTGIVFTGAGQQTLSRQHPNEVSGLRLSSRFPTVSQCELHLQLLAQTFTNKPNQSASPQIYFDPEDEFRKGHAISAGQVSRLASVLDQILTSKFRCLFLSFLAAFALRTRLSGLNKKNERRIAALSEAEKERLETVNEGEVWDNDPRYVFMT